RDRAGAPAASACRVRRLGEHRRRLAVDEIRGRAGPVGVCAAKGRRRASTQGNSVKTEYFIYSILVDAPDRTLVKLGRAASLRQRISEIQTGCPYDIRRVVACDVLDEYEGGMREAQMHELYGQHRLRGEWFDPWGRIATEIDVEGLISDLRDVAAERL